MKPTEDLMNEHKAIKLMLNIMGRIAENMKSRAEPVTGELAEIIDFLMTFADACHHGKEETSLFPALTGAGLSKHSGPIAVMLHEHELGRGFIREMALAEASIQQGDKAAVTRATEAMEEYISLMQNHILKEENVLFPLAERLLPAEMQDKINMDFENIEEKVIGHGVHERYHDLLHRLDAKYHE